MLIAGTTSYDNDAVALKALLSELTSNGNYATRVNNLRNGLGLTGGRKLNGDDGATQTVFNDNDVDVLNGNSDLDAFWANTVADNGGAIDCVHSARNESVFDTDF